MFLISGSGVFLIAAPAPTLALAKEEVPEVAGAEVEDRDAAENDEFAQFIL